ncbi:hypothetical protein DES34_101199 [Brevibacillus brevis]|nr:hypothetical protein DES34_101199 [Brevibacillus brevis]TQK63860.1 hypothetical protein FB479_103730 [Brevibacillus sp. AG162]VEF89347.1 Uncharacterised protein [Brevibacillus brevis]
MEGNYMKRRVNDLRHCLFIGKANPIINKQEAKFTRKFIS